MVVAVVAAVGPTARAGAESAPSPSRPSLTVLVTAGTGGRLVDEDEVTVAALVAAVREEASRARAEGREVLVLDAGRTLLPFAESRFDGGRTMVAVLAAAGCQVLALGPIDLGLGGERLRALGAEAPFPVLGPLAEGAGTTAPGLPGDAVVRTSGGIEVAVVNLFAESFSGEVESAGLAVRPGAAGDLDLPADALRVAVVHSDGRGSSLASRALTWRLVEEPQGLQLLVDPDMGADLLLRREGPGGPVLLLGRRQAGSESWRAARLDLDLEAGGDGGWRPVDAEVQEVRVRADAAQDPRLVARVWATMARFRQRTGDTLPTAAPADRAGLERFVLEAMREAASAEVAILNRGGLRPVEEGLLAGDRLRREAVLRMLSLPQELETVTLTGAELERLAADSASRVDAGGAPRKDGLLMLGLTYDVTEGGVKNPRVNGRQLRADDRYRAVTTGYLLSGGDGYEVLTGHEAEPLVGPAGTAVELREDVVLPRLERAGEPFPDLEARPVWRYGADRLAASLDSVRTSRDPAYDASSDSRAAARDSSSVLAEAILRADRELPGWRWENRLRARFGLLDAAGAEVRETDDDLRLDSSAVFTRATFLGGASPFVAATVNSELRRNRDPDGGLLPRQLEESLSAGAAWSRPMWPRLRLGVVARHYSHVDRDPQLGLTAEAVLRIEPKGAWPGLDGRLLAEHLRDGSSSLTRLDLDLRGLFPLRGSLAFTPALNLYRLDDSTLPGAAEYRRFTLGLSYSWSGRRQDAGARR